MNNIQLTIDQINTMQPLEIALHPLVHDRFVQIYDTLWGAGLGEAAYQRESRFFNQILRDSDNGKLQKATRFSIFNAFLDVAITGLSLEPGSRAQCYLQGRNTNIGDREHPQWEGRLVLTVSGYGELVKRMRDGQIRYADNPVIVYDNDEFAFSERNGQKSIDYTCHFPHTGHRIVAVFIKITRNDGSIDYSVMYQEDWQRLKDYSARNNRRTYNGRTVENPNALYTSNDGDIDPGFLCAKCIKHAFKTYPKVRLGRSTELQSQQTDDIEFNNDFYGIAAGNTNERIDTATGEIKDNRNNSFAPAPDTTTGITVNPADTAPDTDDVF